MLSVTAFAYDVAEEIKSEINADSLHELVPDDLRENEMLGDLDFSYSGASETLSPNTVIEKTVNIFFQGIWAEIGFLTLSLAFLILSSIYKSFSSSLGSDALKDAVSFAISLFLTLTLFSHVTGSLGAVVSYVNTLSDFMKSLLPLMATLMCMQGGSAEAVSTGVVVIVAITLIQQITSRVVIPMVKLLFAFICAGFVSRVNFSGITDTVTSVSSKICTISMSILSAILYFKSAMSSAADNLALRSIKLAASNFIPVVGGMVSESAATLLSAVRVVKSTLGIFGFAVLLYMTLIPVVSFLIKKLSLRVLSAISGVLGCDEACSMFKSVYGVYNILSALMLSSGIFFTIAIALFVKNGVV